MKISLISLVAVAAILAGAFGTGRALATTKHQSQPKTLQIAMRDPGCHWFKVAGKYTAKTTATGSVRLVNLDEAALKVVSRHSSHRIAVGKNLVVGHGSYVIMMVGQAPDDNYLKLTVR